MESEFNHTPLPAESRPAIYYGWKIVAAILALLTFSTGLSFYNHAVILNALASTPSFTVQSASIAISVFFLSGGFTGLWVAKLIRDFDSRICISMGAIVCGCALTSLSVVREVWQLYLVYALFGMGFSASNLIPATTLVTRWFQRRRAMALSIASTGLSLGGVVVTPVSSLLVESQGLARAAPIMGAVYVITVIPIAWIWLKPSPESMGLQVDGIDDETQVQNAELVQENKEPQKSLRVSSTQSGVSFHQAIRGRFFWGVSLAYIFLMLAQVGGIAHQYGLARETLTESQTALAVAILPIASITGRLIGGWVLGFISIRGFAISMMLVQMLSLTFLALTSSIFALCLGLAAFGISVGNILMLQPLLLAEAFGVKDYARIFSISNLMTSWGTAAGPALLGVVYAANQDQYGAAYAVAGIAGVLGLMLFLGGGKLNKHL